MYLEFPTDIRNIISDLLNKKANRRLRLVCEQLNNDFMKYFTITRLTVLRKSTPNEFISLYNDYGRLHLEMENVSDKDIEELNCTHLIIDNPCMLGYNLDDNLKVLELSSSTDTEFIEDISFQRLKLVILKEEELFNLHTEELEINCKEGPTITITQAHIDSIGCKKLTLGNNMTFNPDITIDSLTCIFLPDCLLDEEGCVKSSNIDNLNINKLVIKYMYPYSFDTKFKYDKLALFLRKDQYNELNEISKILVDGENFSDIKFSLQLNNTKFLDNTISYLSNLTDVFLSGCDIDDESTLFLSKCESLSFKNTLITGKYLSQLSCKSLYVDNCINLDPDNLLGNFYENLSADTTYFTSEERENYIRMIELPQARNISLIGRDEIYDDMLEQLKFSESVYINGCSVEGFGLKYLTSCKILYIDYSQLILEYLSELPKCVDSMYLGKSFQELEIPCNISADIILENRNVSDLETESALFSSSRGLLQFISPQITNINPEHGDRLSRVVDSMNNLNSDNNYDVTQMWMEEMSHMINEEGGDEYSDIFDHFVTAVLNNYIE